MKVAFHSPLKSPNHPVPSGDRLMARLLIAALQQAGHEVQVVSELRAFLRDATDAEWQRLASDASEERRRIDALWRRQGEPDLWFTYHPYYKAPDLLGPKLCREHQIPYVTAEASWSGRRNRGSWALAQENLLDALRMASVNICLTGRDRTGLMETDPSLRTERLVPFLDTADFLVHDPVPTPGRLIAVAMMRPGDKMDSYRFLARALARLADTDWTLSVVGAGPCADEVGALFAPFGERIAWHGEQDRQAIARLMSESAVYVWPGCGEAYGLAYLEAQAAGLPVVAQAIAGVPEVVVHGRTGLLTPAGDEIAYADAILQMLADTAMRREAAAEARRFVRDERSITQAAATLGAIIETHVRRA